MIDLHNLIQAYISERENFFDRERYKWEAVKSFQEYYKKECYSLENQLRYPFDVANNLLLSHNYYPAGMLCTFAREKTDETQACLDNLYDESLPLSERIWAFINGTERIFMTLKEEGFSDWKARTNVQSYQDPHTVSVYLALKFPQKYYIYKWSIFKQAAEKLDYTIKSKDKVSKLLEFYDFCGTIKKAILNEKEFLKDYRTKLKTIGLSDDNYTLLTQDFIYAIVNYINADAYLKDGKSIVRNVKEIKSSSFDTEIQKVETEFRGKKGVDYTRQDNLLRDLGLKGEMWVVNYEKERLAKQGIKFEVRHASLLDGDGLGYDVLSVENDGVTHRYIEVKTTTGGIDRPLFFSKRELERSIKDAKHFYLYRVCNFKDVDKQADVVIINGSLAELNATPIAFEVSVKKT